MKNKDGYILQEALVSIMITILTVSITFACFNAYLNSETRLKILRKECNERISMELNKRKECIQCNQNKDLP